MPGALNPCQELQIHAWSSESMLGAPNPCLELRIHASSSKSMPGAENPCQELQIHAWGLKSMKMSSRQLENAFLSIASWSSYFLEFCRHLACSRPLPSQELQIRAWSSESTAGAPLCGGMSLLCSGYLGRVGFFRIL